MREGWKRRYRRFREYCEKYCKKYFNKKNSYGVLFVIALILGSYGLYSYYNATMEVPWRVILATGHGLIDIFTLSAPLPLEEDTPISYEIARLLATIWTANLILTGITHILVHWFNSFKNHWSKNHIVIFEKTDDTDVLIHNLLGTSKGYEISLICKDPIVGELKTKHENRGVAVHFFDFDYNSSNEVESFLRRIKINSVKAMIFASPDDLRNYALFSHVIQKLKPKNEINCYIRCESSFIPIYLEEMLNKEKENEASLSNVDIIPFNQDELSVRLLMKDIVVKEGILEPEPSSLLPSTTTNMEDKTGILELAFKRLRESVQEENFTVDSIEETVGQMRFLILGVSELISPLLFTLVNDAVLTTGGKMQVIIVDKDAEATTQDFSSQNKEILNVLEIEAISVDIHHCSFEEKLKEWKQESSFTAIFFVSEDTLGNLSSLNVVDRYFSDVPKAFRNISGIDLNPLLPDLDKNRIYVFGDVNKVMTEDILLRTRLDERAREFNESYNYASRCAGMGGGNEWSELSQTKKNSSRASASHAKVKEEILRSLYPSKSDGELKEMLNEYFEEFKLLQDERSSLEGEYKEKFRTYMDEHPVLDFLARLEHKRWCNSYYAMNFKYGPVKDEKNKTHPCLIEDWSVVMGEKFEVCHPEYDLIGIFALFSGEDRNE